MPGNLHKGSGPTLGRQCSNQDDNFPPGLEAAAEEGEVSSAKREAENGEASKSKADLIQGHQGGDQKMEEFPFVMFIFDPKQDRSTQIKALKEHYLKHKGPRDQRNSLLTDDGECSETTAVKGQKKTRRLGPQLEEQNHRPNKPDVTTLDEPSNTVYDVLEVQKIDNFFCPVCELTWLVGAGSSEVSQHPHHNSMSPTILDTTGHRRASLVVHLGCDAKFIRDHPAGYLANVQYYGPESRWNAHDVFVAIRDKPTRQLAELVGLVHLVYRIKERILPYWTKVCNEFDQDTGKSLNNFLNSPSPHNDNSVTDRSAGHPMGPSRAQMNAQNEILRKAGFLDADSGRLTAPVQRTTRLNKAADSSEPKMKGLRVLVATDSDYLVDMFTKNVETYNWNEDTQRYYKKSGKPVQYSEFIKDVVEQLDVLKSEHGVEIIWWKLPLYMNTLAKGIAKSILVDVKLDIMSKDQKLILDPAL